MRLLCDEHVPNQFLQAFSAEEWIDCTTVRDQLYPGATDEEVAQHAIRTDRVIFTNDDDFYQTAGDHGLILYQQYPPPAVADIVYALRRINTSYEDTTQIEEWVPGAWV